MNPTFFDFHLFPVPDTFRLEERASGAGEKGIWIWYQASKQDQPEIEHFMNKVFSAAGIDLAQDTRFICLTSEETISFSQIAECRNARFTFLFGVSGNRLGLHFQLTRYQPVQFGKTAFILADPISDIYEERQAGKTEKSGQLWRTLKACFTV